VRGGGSGRPGGRALRPRILGSHSLPVGARAATHAALAPLGSAALPNCLPTFQTRMGRRILSPPPDWGPCAHRGPNHNQIRPKDSLGKEKALSCF
jgi:hypothetical protein